jgi:hypothetical protein
MRHARHVILTAFTGIVVGCSPPSSTTGDPGAGGGSAGAGGGSGTGGAAAGSGGSQSTGGASGTAGVAGAAGGASTGASGRGGASGASAGISGSSGAAGGAAGTVGGGGAAGGTVGGGGASGGTAGAAGSAGGAGAAQTGVENRSADCVVATLPAANSLTTKISKLPDPFKKLDGTRVASQAEWRCRRQEIRKQAEAYILGAKPMPDVVTGAVSSSKITVHVEAKGKSIDFSVTVKLPTTGQAPFPALINVGTTNTLTDTRILDQGVAVITYNNYDLGQEGTAQMSRGKPNTGKYYDIYGGNDPAGLLIAWAWGASRVLDVIQQSGGGMFDMTGIGVTGCSRWGKGAFVLGVFDDRIALTIPQEPSTGGDPALRIMDVLPGAERTDYNYNGLNWLSNNFAPFVYANNTSNAVRLPIDTNALIGMIAPRGLLVLENPHQTQMGAPAGYMATLAGLEVYKALGMEKNVSYHSDVADTAHCSYKTEYTDVLVKSMAAFLKHTGDPPGLIKVGSGGSLNRSDWIDWTTPMLP